MHCEDMSVQSFSEIRMNSQTVFIFFPSIIKVCKLADTRSFAFDNGTAYK